MLGDRALELPVPHRREQRRAGARWPATPWCSSTPRRRRCARERFAEACDGGRAAAGVFQICVLRTTRPSRIARRTARRLRRVHGLGGRRPRDPARGGRHASSALGLELGGSDPAYVRARRRTSTHAIENIVDGAFFNSRPVAAAASSASTCTSSVYDNFVEGLRRSHAQLRARRSARRRRRRSVRWCAARGATSCARRSPRRSRPAPRRSSTPKRFARRHGRHAVSRAAGAARMSITRMPRDARGDLRARRRHHEGAAPTTKPSRLMNDSALRADRRDLDQDATRPSAHRRRGSRPAPGS